MLTGYTFHISRGLGPKTMIIFWWLGLRRDIIVLEETNQICSICPVSGTCALTTTALGFGSNG